MNALYLSLAIYIYSPTPHDSGLLSVHLEVLGSYNTVSIGSESRRSLKVQVHCSESKRGEKREREGIFARQHLHISQMASDTGPWKMPRVATQIVGKAGDDVVLIHPLTRMLHYGSTNLRYADVC